MHGPAVSALIGDHDADAVRCQIEDAWTPQRSAVDAHAGMEADQRSAGAGVGVRNRCAVDRCFARRQSQASVHYQGRGLKMDTSHIALLGDSIFDNRAYTGGEPDVVSHLRAALPTPWRATLVAVDGSTTSSIRAQVARVPADAAHVVVAVGGNDALGHQDLLAAPVRSSAETLAMFATRLREFESDYRRAIDLVVALRRTTILCTVYNGNLEEPRATLARVGLTTFNDVILRTAFEQH